MNRHLSYVLFLLWLCYLIITSILLFTRGFLLTRVVQPNNSTCLSYKDVACSNNTSLLMHSSEDYDQCSVNEDMLTILKKTERGSVCLPQKSRVILLIVDALRHDFTLFDNENVNPLPFQNKLPILNKLQTLYPESSRLYKFIADPPTTTMQRLKALTTGSLPTFIDAGSNFATYEINEDNLIDQLNRNGYKSVFMGDDTWDGLYPNRFIRNYPYPSFNVWDLDTVDYGVISNLFFELKKEDWSLLIGHFLGVDHVGHKHGPNHSEMARKLSEINEVIEKVVQQIDNNTMLFVIGDHGMTSTGDHGGESKDEVTAGMFVYSKNPLSTYGRNIDSIKQVDLVPTLATILGVPIPFQNLGCLVLNCLPILNGTSTVHDWQLSLYSLWANVEQMMEYIKQYSKETGSFKESILKTHFDKYEDLKKIFSSIRTEQNFIIFAKDVQNFVIDLRTMCEEVWVQFDSFSMTRGLLFLFLSIFFGYLIVDGIPLKSLPEIFDSSFILCSYLALLLSSGVVLLLYYFNKIENLLLSTLFANGVVSQLMLVMLIVQNWEVISDNWHERQKQNRIQSIIPRLILLINLAGLFSNSYIIEESFVLLFLLVTAILVGSCALTSPISDNKKKSEINLIRWSKLKLLFLSFVIAALVRCTMYFWRCREEQQWCFAFPHEVNTITAKAESSRLQYFVTLICLGIFVFVTKLWLRDCGNLNGYSVNVILAKYMPSVLVVCIAGYWGLSNRSKNHLNPYQTENILAWVVYGFVYFGVTFLVFEPLCVYILPGKDDSNETINTKQNIIPQLFDKIKKCYSEKKNKEDIPIVCGLGTVYSAVYVITGTYLTLLFCLLLGDSVAPSSVIMFLTSGFILIIISVVRIETTNSIENLFEVPNMYILVWVILSQYFFYATGHQAAFPNINWESAFVGLRGITMKNYIPATLVILNTFCSYILIGFLLPLIVIAPFNIFVMIPSVIAKRNYLQSASQRGEVLLYERDDLMITSTFTIACKYIMCHGLRVFASMLAATIHCRHLMVWKIFAPKLIFESVSMIVTLSSVVLGYLVLLRINNKVDKLVTHLNKLS